MSSLYIHIPFCQSKCGYCSFSSWPGLESVHASYVEAVHRELTETAKQYSGGPLTTLFFGGGTPTMLSSRQLIRLLNCCVDNFGVERDAEVSIEANPGTIERIQLDDLKKAGFSRASVGVQSFLAEDLKALGRGHTSSEAVSAIMDLRAAGFENISLDLMYGLPNQTVESWCRNLEKAIALGPEHISMYQLTIEDGTAFAGLAEKGMLDLPSEETIIAMDEVNLSHTGSAGYEWYEISNYAKPGFRCRHNLAYWHNEEYLAAGAGAVSYLGGVRERRVDDPVEYIARIMAGNKTVIEREHLAQDDAFKETVIMGLRLTEGVKLEQLQARFGMDPFSYYGTTLKKLLDAGFMESSDTHLRVSEKGRLLSNAILSELV